MATVLVAEDDVTIRELVRLVLGGSGHEVISCADGPTALTKARRERPDVAILDVNMPGLDGFSVCRALRERDDTALLPVLMLTSSGQWLDVSTGFDAGADDYLVKPFEPKVLLERVSALLDAGGS